MGIMLRWNLFETFLSDKRPVRPRVVSWARMGRAEKMIIL